MNAKQTKQRKKRLQRRAKSLPQVLREFLTPGLWKQANQVRRSGRRSSRWATQPLMLTLLIMTWCCGDSQAERFETARSFCIVCRPKQRRPGKSVQGFEMALARLPMGVLRTLAAGIRRVLARRLKGRWLTQGFIPFGCDGSRIECRRTQALEKRLAPGGKANAAPTIWVTALVHLRLGLPWAWRFGKGTASERSHLEYLIRWLPKQALLVCDAGYTGYELAQRLLQSPVEFLIRWSSSARLYTAEQVAMERFKEGVVYYWPKKQEAAGAAPLKLRLLRVRGKKKNSDVWLLTNVMEAKRLPVSLAAQFYRWRWESEGQFRAYKRTVKKMKLVSGTVRMVHREAEGSWLALQLLLAQGVLAMPVSKEPVAEGESEAVCSPRKVLLEVRREMLGLVRRGQPRYYERLRQAQRERRKRTSPKAVRKWPRRKEHKAPGPPKILTLTDQQKACVVRWEKAAA